jgi:hypothetical protein
MTACPRTSPGPGHGVDSGVHDSSAGDASADAAGGGIVVIGGRGIACQIDGMATVQLPRRDYQAVSGTGYEVQYSGANLTVFLEGPAQPGGEAECGLAEMRRVHVVRDTNVWTDDYRPPQVGGGHGDCAYVLLNGYNPGTHGFYEASVTGRLVRAFVGTTPDEIHATCHVIDEYFF